MRAPQRILPAVLAVFAIVGAACSNNSSTIEPGSGTSSSSAPTFTTIAEGKLTVGSCLDYKPFEYKQGDQLKGFDVDLTDEIASRLGLEVEWVKANFDTIFTAVAANQFDMVAAASTITPEREQTALFSDPYFNARQSLTVNTTKTPDIQSTDDLASGDIVAVQKGTTGKDWATENLEPNGIQIKVFDLAPDAFTDLEAGNVTGIINDEPSSDAEVESRPDLAVVEGIDTGEHYGLAFSPDNPDLKDAVDGALAEIIADGTYAEIFDRYFPGVEVPPEYQAS
jgi:ABC-type amino acid transport substrate-binding protein